MFASFNRPDLRGGAVGHGDNVTTEFPCAACAKPIKFSASKCPHCGHKVSQADIDARRGGSEFDGKALLGCIGVPVLIAFAAYMIVTSGPSAEERRASNVKFAEEYELKEQNARFACDQWGLAKACAEIDSNAELARYYRQQVKEADEE